MGLFDSLLGGGILGLAGDVVGGLFGSNSAAKANKANIKLARENRDWQAQMDNTAVQRRVADVKAAGGNPALVFTGGQSASTPAVASPTVEPTFRPEWTKGSTAQATLLKAQLANLNANTANTAAMARKNAVEAKVTETYGMEGGLADIQTKWHKSTQELLRKYILENQMHTSAAEREKAEKSVDPFIQKLRQEAELGRLDMESAQRIAKEFGLSTGPTSTFMRMIIDILRLMKKD